jgi:hypothetical protein
MLVRPARGIDRADPPDAEVGPPSFPGCGPYRRTCGPGCRSQGGVRSRAGPTRPAIPSFAGAGCHWPDVARMSHDRTR